MIAISLRITRFHNLEVGPRANLKRYRGKAFIAFDLNNIIWQFVSELLYTYRAFLLIRASELED